MCFESSLIPCCVLKLYCAVFEHLLLANTVLCSLWTLAPSTVLKPHAHTNFPAGSTRGDQGCVCCPEQWMWRWWRGGNALVSHWGSHKIARVACSVPEIWRPSFRGWAATYYGRCQREPRTWSRQLWGICTHHAADCLVLSLTDIYIVMFYWILNK